MIEIKTNDGKVSVKAVGGLKELMTDTIVIVHAIWDSIKDHDEDSANTFAFAMTKAFKDGVVFGEADEIAKRCLDSEKKMSESDDSAKDPMQIMDDMRGLINAMRELLNEK